MQPAFCLMGPRAVLLLQCALLLAIPRLGQGDTAPKPGRFFPPLERMPLEGPLVITSSFGESRRGHFHAGLDFATGGQVGQPVFAPLSGRIERVRMSGVGYGRSLYLRSRDGRLLVFGHLDAFAEPLGSHVAAIQDSTGQYEQDLWPDSTAFPVRAGQRIAWSGESGAGPPHLHMEIRRGDVALNPLEAGVRLTDRSPPRLESVTLEPLDHLSFVERAAVPHTVRLRSHPDTIEAIGRFRVVVKASDAIGAGRARAAPWWVGIEMNGHAVECRFDSASWAGEMSEADYVYERESHGGQGGVVLWAPSDFRPRPLSARGMPSGAWGLFELRPNDPPRTLRISAGDIAGNVTEREIVLVPAATEGAPVSRMAPERTARTVALPEWSLTSLPGGNVGLRLRDGPECRFERVSIGSVSEWLSGAGSQHGAVLRLEERKTSSWVFEGEGPSGAGPCRAEGPPMRLSALTGRDHFAGLEWSVPEGALFEWAVVLAETSAKITAPTELIPVGPAYAFHPSELPLRQPIRFRLTLGARDQEAGLGLYQETPERRWEFVRARFDSASGLFQAESRRLGRIAVFRDLTPPRIRATRARGSRKGPYSRWALESQLEERGSGVEAAESYFEIDGRRVPTEWDSEASTMRWRPLAPPSKGQHRYRVFARDRGGNLARAEGTFVVN